MAEKDRCDTDMGGHNGSDRIHSGKTKTARTIQRLTHIRWTGVIQEGKPRRKKQDKQYTYNVTLVCVHIIIVAMEKQ
jgi:hypothetical protein